MQLTKALPTSVGGFSSALSLLALDFNQPMTFGVDASTGAAGTQYTVYGCVDTASSGASPNVTPLLTFQAPVGGELPPSMAQALRGWPCLLIQSPAGGAAGTFFVNGTAAETLSALASVTAPALKAFSAKLDASGFGTTGTRYGASAAMTASDVFQIYVFQDPAIDPTVTGAAGTQLAGTVSGGGGAALDVAGWPYATAKRTSGATPGAILGAGVAPSGGAAGAWLLNGNTGGAGAALGNADNQPLPIETNGIVRMTVLGGAAASGFVGIGVTTPASRLHVVEPTAGPGFYVARFAGAGTVVVGMGLENTDATSVAVDLTLGGSIAGTKNWSLRTDPASSGAQSFQIKDNLAGSPRVWIDAAGNVAIGGAAAVTPSRGATVDVQGSTGALGVAVMTSAQRNTWAALPPARVGQMIFNSTVANFEFWNGASVSPLGAVCSVQANTTNAQSVADGAAPAIVTTWTATTNTATALTVATGVFVAPSAGFYQVAAQVEFAALASIVQGEFAIGIYKNGALVVTGVEVCQVAAANCKRNPKVALGLQLASGDSIDIRASQNSGSGANALTNSATRNVLSISRVSN